LHFTKDLRRGCQFYSKKHPKPESAVVGRKGIHLYIHRPTVFDHFSPPVHWNMTPISPHSARQSLRSSGGSFSTSFGSRNPAKSGDSRTRFMVHRTQSRCLTGSLSKTTRQASISALSHCRARARQTIGKVSRNEAENSTRQIDYLLMRLKQRLIVLPEL